MSNWTESTTAERFDGIKVLVLTIAHGPKNRARVIRRSYEAHVFTPGTATPVVLESERPFYDPGYLRDAAAFHAEAAAPHAASACSADDLAILSFYARPGFSERPAPWSEAACKSLVARGLLVYSGADFDLTTTGRWIGQKVITGSPLCAA